MKYQIELTEAQVKVVQTALEEYFRLRMGQERDFCDDMASIDCDLSPDNPNHNRIFDLYIARRNHLQELMRAFFRIALEPTGYLNEKNEQMMIAEDIWDSLRFVRGQSRWSSVLHIGPEPVPTIRKVDDEHD